MSTFATVASSLDTFSRDCAVTVALKISDDSCKMDDEQRSLFISLYDALPAYTSELFDPSVHDLIRDARTALDAMLYARIKKERERAMALITQEKMKAFKASVRGMLIIATLSSVQPI